MIDEKILLERLEEEYINCFNVGDYKHNKAIDKVKDIVNQLAEEMGASKMENTNGWIPCSERLPSKRDWYLTVFQEVDTGFIGLPFIADYLMGVHTKYTTDDGWIIANCTDVEEDRAEYYKKLKCIAWQPLPAPYQPKEDKQK